MSTASSTAGNSPTATGGTRAEGGMAPIATSEGSDTDADIDDAGAMDPPIPPTPLGLVIEPNPNNTLSCYVSWTTEEPARSEVDFGKGQFEFRIVQDELVTQHRVLVIGMHATTDYMIQAVSTNTKGTGKLQGRFTTGALPDNLPLATLDTNDTASSQLGWTLTNIMPAGASPGYQGTVPGIMVMYDQAGIPVWYYVNGNTPDMRGDVSLLILPNGNILLGPSSGEPAKEVTMAGNVVWKGPPQPTTDATNVAPMSHYAGKLKNGNYVLLRDNSVNGIQGALIEEVNPSNEVVWSWNLFDHKQPGASVRTDWCHPNSVTIDLDKDVFYLSCRWLGVIKAKRSGDKAIEWVLGGEGGGDFTFNPSSAAFSDQHDPEFHADGTVLLYNNAGESLGGPAYQSRVLEFSLNESRLRANLNFQFPGTFDVDPWFTSSWSTPYWGDADRLANGNILITIGYRADARATHIVEVRRTDGKVMWEIELPFFVGSYQAERWSPPPLVVPY